MPGRSKRATVGSDGGALILLGFRGSPALWYWWRIRRGSDNEGMACAPHPGGDAAQASGGG